MAREKGASRPRPQDQCRGPLTPAPRAMRAGILGDSRLAPLLSLGILGQVPGSPSSHSWWAQWVLPPAICCWDSEMLVCPRTFFGDKSPRLGNLRGKEVYLIYNAGDLRVWHYREVRRWEDWFLGVMLQLGVKSSEFHRTVALVRERGAWALWVHEPFLYLKHTWWGQCHGIVD